MATITEFRIFNGLSNIELAKILGRLDKRELPAGSRLFEQGDPGDSMFLIERGKVQLSTALPGGASQPLAMLSDGDTLGEMALLTGEARSATAVTATPAVLFVMDKDIFEKLIVEHPLISTYFIGLLSSRLVQTNDRLQQSNEAKARWIAQALEDMPGDWRRFLEACSLFPRMNRKLARDLLGIEEVDRIGDWLSRPEEFIRFDPGLSGRQEEQGANGEDDSPGSTADAAQWFAIAPAVRGTLRASLAARMTAAQLGELRDTATRMWRADGEWAAAIRMYAEAELWDDAIGAAESAPEPYDGFDALDRCPIEALGGARFAVLDRYLRYCAAHAREAGFARAEAALDAKGLGFGTGQLVLLHERAAEICRALGMQAKALEHLAMAEALATAPRSAAGAASTESDAEAGERAYRLAKQKLDRQLTKDLASKAGSLLGGNRWSGLVALLVAATCLGYFHFADPVAGLSRHGMDFIGIGLAAVALWIVNVIPDYIVALVMAMFWVLGGLVPPEVALSGFSSTTWLYMLFILALGATITKSGILFRLSLHALKRFPANYRGQLWGIVAGGTLLNPLIPSSSAKVTLGVPIARTLSESMGFKDRSDGAAGLGLAAMVFYGFLAPFVLTGSYSNVMAFGLVGGGKTPNWFEWFLYALPAFLLFAGLILAFLFLKFRNVSSAKPISQEVLDDQLRLIGKLSKEELVTVWTVVGCIALMILQPLHGIDNAWVMLVGFAMLVLTKTLDAQTLKTGVDWTFLLFIGIAFSFAEAAKRLGIVEAMSSYLGDKMSAFIDVPVLFLAAVMLLSFVVTFVVRDDPALILLVVALLPLAEQAGIHPWVLVFVILLSTDPFFFAYQSPTYLTAYYSAEGKSFSHRQGQWMALGYAAAAMAAVLASVPYWKWLGLID
ncbi:SLC13 family permease [Cohnella sp. GCM10027633]|uniref:SLC13 family permease n=1 Tax=unclassified Cohnella TaxID=2636738 RepID=UPI0036261A8B